MMEGNGSVDGMVRSSHSTYAETADLDTQRILDKLDLLQGEVTSVAKEQARIQGAQDGMKTAIAAVSNAIGDVSRVKIDAATLGTKLDAFSERLTHLEHDLSAKDWRLWVERLASGVFGGGVVAAILSGLG